MNYANSMKLKISLEFHQKLNGERFSIFLDEWTSGVIKRYFFLNLHCLDKCLYGLGMIRINGSMPSERAVIIVTDKLNEFGLNFTNNIFGCAKKTDFSVRFRFVAADFILIACSFECVVLDFLGKASCTALLNHQIHSMGVTSLMLSWDQFSEFNHHGSSICN